MKYFLFFVWIATALPANASGQDFRVRLRAEVIVEALERVVRVERDRRALGVPLVAEPDVVVDELPPDPPELRDAVLGEEVLVHVVEDAVTDGAGVRSARHRAPAVAVMGRRDP